MDKLKLTLNQSKSTFKQTNTKKKKEKEKEKPFKVVYISNPMWFQTSPAEFRDLVQKVTGRDSDIADNMADTTLPHAVVVPSPPAKIGIRRPEELSVADQVVDDWTMFFDAPESLPCK